MICCLIIKFDVRVFFILVFFYKELDDFWMNVM